jgi:hypothetical protein
MQIQGVRMPDARLRKLNARRIKLNEGLGGKLPIPLANELVFLEALSLNVPECRADIQPIADQLTTRQSYSLVIFSVRMSVYSVRQREAVLLLNALPALVIDNDSVDWRDILVALSIVEDCASRTGLNASTALENIARIASFDRADTIREGYLSRAPNMRAVNVMGFVAIEDQHGVQYVRRA